MAIQRSLNVEHKHIDYTFGSQGIIRAQLPTNNTPIIIPLNTPIRGTSFNNRVGNQLKVTHMTAKYQFQFHNNTDLMQRQTARCRIIFAKNASDIPDITQLMDKDANGHYTPLSFINTQEYKKFVWMKSLDTRCGYTQPTNRYPPSDTNSRAEEITSPGDYFPVTAVAAVPLNVATFYNCLNLFMLATGFPNKAHFWHHDQPETARF